MLRIITTVLLSLAVATTIGASGLSTPQGHANRVLIPAAISADGANGTKFRSDIRITNLRDVPQRIVVYWLPAGVAGSFDVFEILTLQPNETLASDDFVGEVLKTSGLGVIGVDGLDADDDVDPAARIHVTSRVWTPQPGSEGTSSQAFTPVPFPVVSENVFIFGHRRNDQYRTNVGIVNFDGAEHTFLVTVSGENPTLLPEEYRVTVPRFSLMQFPTSGAPQNQLRIGVQQEAGEGGTPRTEWIAYASSVDNVTGDGWTTVGASRASN